MFTLSGLGSQPSRNLEIRLTILSTCAQFLFIDQQQLTTIHRLAVEAATKALLDAGINYDSIEQAYASYVYGDSCSGQRALYALGMTGIPIINVK